MPRLRISPLSAVGIFVVAGLALTGCSGADSEREGASESSSSAPAPSPTEEESTDDAGGSDQTVAEACAALQEGLETIQTDLTENLSNFENDPAAASAALDEVTQTFSANVDEVTNAEIAPLAVAADEALVELNDIVAAAAGGDTSFDPAAATESATNLQTTFTDVGAACS